MLAILVIVIGALTQLFVSASTAQVDMTRRFEAQQEMRLALDKLRREIHCAKRRDALERRRPPASATIEDHARHVLPDEQRQRDDCHVVHEAQAPAATTSCATQAASAVPSCAATARGRNGHD